MSAYLLQPPVEEGFMCFMICQYTHMRGCPPYMPKSKVIPHLQ